MVSILNIVALVTLAVFANGDTDYCSLKSCDGPNHTLCRFNVRDDHAIYFFPYLFFLRYRLFVIIFIFLFALSMRLVR